GRLEGQVWIFGVLGVDAIPALDDLKRGRLEEPGDIAKNQYVNLFLIKDVEAKSIFVRIAEREFTCCGLRYQTVNSPMIVLSHFCGDALLELRQSGADSKRRIEAKSEPGGKRGAQSPATGLRFGSHHLQLDSR